MWLRDTGVLNKLRNDVLNPAIPIPYPKVRHNEPLNNWQLGIIMIIYLVGMLISIMAFVGEILNAKEKQPKSESAFELNNMRSADKPRPRRSIFLSLID